MPHFSDPCPRYWIGETTIANAIEPTNHVLDRLANMKLICSLILLLLLSGCASSPTVSRNQLENMAHAHDGFTFPSRAYYCGTKEGYDYFAIQGFGVDSRTDGVKIYRVRESENTIPTRFPLTLNRSEWHIHSEIIQQQTNNEWLSRLSVLDAYELLELQQTNNNWMLPGR